MSLTEDGFTAGFWTTRDDSDRIGLDLLNLETAILAGVDVLAKARVEAKDATAPIRRLAFRVERAVREAETSAAERIAEAERLAAEAITHAEADCARIVAQVEQTCGALIAKLHGAGACGPPHTGGPLRLLPLVAGSLDALLRRLLTERLRAARHTRHRPDEARLGPGHGHRLRHPRRDARRRARADRPLPAALERRRHPQGRRMTRAEWVARELAKAPAITEAQRQALRRLLADRRTA